MPEAHHRAVVDARVGALHLRADVTFSAPWTVLFGPSGSGKTTLLRALCGLVPGAAVSDFDRRDGRDWRELDGLPPHRRQLAYAPQHSALFPHLSVEENLGFARAGPSQVQEVAALFELGPLLGRRPAALSGGEQRRVALARAFCVPYARLMLLDEPFAGLDRGMRDRLIPQMKEWLASRSIATISVTHDVDEAFLLADEVVRIGEGQVVAQGAARDVLAGERERLLATLA